MDTYGYIEIRTGNYDKWLNREPSISVSINSSFCVEYYNMLHPDTRENYCNRVGVNKDWANEQLSKYLEKI